MASNTDILDAVTWNQDGLVAAIAQDSVSGEVLMMAWMNREALQCTIAEGRAIYWSRSRQKLWRKGEDSGNVQELDEVRLDCDGDTVLLRVRQIGGIACHTGRANCFYRLLQGDEWQVTEPVIKDPSDIYGQPDE